MESSTTMTLPPGPPDCRGVFSCLPFFVAGVVGLAVVECLLLLYLLQRLLHLNSSPTVRPVSHNMNLTSEDSSISLQGNAWVAPIPENMDLSKVFVKQIRKAKKDKDGNSSQKEGSRRGENTKDALEIAPMRRHAFLTNKALFLRAPDGTDEHVSLDGCDVFTVSSSPGESRKWGKKYPIKLRHPDRALYRGCKTFFFYAQSGYAKEAWCEAFRAMAKMGNPVSKWAFDTKRKYKEYTHVAEENMPWLAKFYAGDDEAIGQGVFGPHKGSEEAEGGPTSKKRMMWRKLARKASMGREHKETRFAHVVDEVHRKKQQPRNNTNSAHDDDTAWRTKESPFYDEERVPAACPAVDPNFDRATSFDELVNGDEEVAAVSAGEGSHTRKDNNREPQQKAPRKAKEDSSARKEVEQGVLCLNMIVARLYYDFNHSQRRLAGVERFFQRLLMKIRKPTYIKSITIKEMDLGRHPPFATAIRMLPADAGGTLAMEVDLEWHGGGHLTCETRLDLREQSTQESVTAQLAESGSEGDVTAAVLSGLRGDFDEAADSASSFSAAVQEGRRAGLPNKKGRWMQSVKSMLSRLADQVSQVPLVLKIRLVSLKGTAVFKLKAPPSDRVWFAFKTMPDIHFEPEPCIGEHRISNGPLAKLIVNQIKVQIRESVVLPYCEDFFLSWMMADKHNWFPHSTFPFPFFDSQASGAEHETSKQMAAEAHSSSSDESTNNRPSLPGPNPQTNKPPKNTIPLKSQKHAHDELLQPRRSSSDVFLSRGSAPKPPRSASSDYLRAQGSVPNRKGVAPGRVRLSSLVSAPVEVSGAALLGEGSGSGSMGALLGNEGGRKGEGWEEGGEVDLGAVRMAVDARSRECSSHSEGSASESDVQFLATQVANPKDVKESDHGSKLTRRARVLTLGKKVLGEARHNVGEKLHHHKRPDDVEGSVQRWAHEAPFA